MARPPHLLVPGTWYLEGARVVQKLDWSIYHLYYVKLLSKLDGVGPVDNRPSPDKLNHFVKKK